MSDSSEEEDLSRFREAVDSTFVCSINDPYSTLKSSTKEPNLKSDRYLEESSHYNDVKVPQALQNKIGAKVSDVIQRMIEFVDVADKNIKKRKVKGGVKLFKDSEDFLSCSEAKDLYTEHHNREAKKACKVKRNKHLFSNYELNEEDKLKTVAVSGEYVLSKEETKCWKSRRKEKIFKYKSSGKNNELIAIE